jgi:hypothetical protein
MQRPVAHAAPLAALLCAIAVAGFGGGFAEFSHLQHPIGLLGASLVPRAGAFNVLAFILPGVLAAVAAVGARGHLAGAGWPARIGAQALLLSALAFAAQGLFPLDSTDIDGAGSRLHAAAWTAWWIASGVGAALLAWGSRKRRDRHMPAAAACFAAAVLFALLLPGLLPAGLSQRIAYAAWFAGLWLAGRLSRTAA